MNTITHTYKFVKRHLYEFKKSNDSIYNGFSNNDVFIRENENDLKLKIRSKNKYPFTRINFQTLIPNKLWFGKFPDSEDLLIVKKKSTDFEILIYQKHWKYRFLFLSDLESNLGEYYNKMI